MGLKSSGGDDKQPACTNIVFQYCPTIAKNSLKFTLTIFTFRATETKIDWEKKNDELAKQVGEKQYSNSTSLLSGQKTTNKQNRAKY